MREDSPALETWLEEEGALLRLRLSRPKANIIDAEMTAALDRALQTHLSRAGLLAVLIDAEGPNFSFGASVEEHLPERCAAMLKGFHSLLLRLLEAPVAVLVAARGQCLGGGLELALAANLFFLAPDARLGQPEIKLGVIAPAASALLPEKIPLAAAEDLLLSGRSIGAEEARSLGLAGGVALEPEKAALAWFKEHLAGKSAAALYFARKAVRLELAARVSQKLAAIERLYLEELMATRDAKEGLNAFLEKRRPRWEHR